MYVIYSWWVLIFSQVQRILPPIHKGGGGVQHFEGQVGRERGEGVVICTEF